MKAPVLPRIGLVRQDMAQGEIESAVREVSTSPIARGQQTSRVTIEATGTAQEVTHRLGRTPTGWIVVSVTGLNPAIQVTSVTATRIKFASLAAAPGESSWAWWVY